jgi:hypothetical protein
MSTGVIHRQNRLRRRRVPSGGLFGEFVSTTISPRSCADHLPFQLTEHGRHRCHGLSLRGRGVEDIDGHHDRTRHAWPVRGDRRRHAPTEPTGQTWRRPAGMLHRGRASRVLCSCAVNIPGQTPTGARHPSSAPTPQDGQDGRAVEAGGRLERDDDVVNDGGRCHLTRAHGHGGMCRGWGGQ